MKITWDEKITAAELVSMQNNGKGISHCFEEIKTVVNANADAAGINPPIDVTFAAGDDTTDHVADAVNAAYSGHFPRDITTISEVWAGVVTAPVGSVLTVDIELNGTSIFSTLITIDSTETTSLTAETPAVLTTTAATKGDLLEAFVTTIGSSTAGAGLKIYILGN